MNCSKAPNTYFTGSGGMTDACPVKLCGRDDEECDLGMYRQDCGTVENPASPGICAPCVLHKEKYFWVSNGDVSRRGCNEAPCQRCSAGFVRIGCEGASEGTCEPCSYEPGFFFTADGGFGERNLTCPRSPCSDCPPGFQKNACGSDADHISPGACVECEAGKYQNESYQDLCVTAPSGTFAVRGSRIYTECPEGHYQDEQGKSECHVCKGGDARRRRSEMCTPCAVGRYNDGSRDSCEVCLGAVRQDGSNESFRVACDRCSMGWYANEASDTCDFCSGGYVSTDTDTRKETCTPCPPDWYNDGSSSECAPCVAGHETSTAGSTACHQCQKGERPSAGACTAVPCPIGSSGPDVASGCVCNIGSAGTIYATLGPPYFSGECRPLEVRVMEPGTNGIVWGKTQGASDIYKYNCGGQAVCELSTGEPRSESDDENCAALIRFVAAEATLCV